MSASLELSRMILSPLARYLAGKRLLIVADGVLAKVPFAALPIREDQTVVESGSSAMSDAIPAIVKHEIVVMPSTSALGLLRRAFANRVPPTGSIAVFADPVFNSSDDRVRRTTKRHALARPKKTPLKRVHGFAAPPARDFRRLIDGTLPRLHFSAREADAVCALAPQDGINHGIVKRLGFESTKAAVLDPSLKAFRIIHFATHTVLDDDLAELSGIVMSLYDRNGNPIDGFVRLLDIYGLDLNADLVVLSGCDTALGKNVKAEGLVGLTRGFMYAGAARVVASLWKVDDEATTELMTRFYTAMFLEKQRPAAALRTAQLWMRQQKRWKSPKYWAAFVLQGEWR